MVQCHLTVLHQVDAAGKSMLYLHSPCCDSSPVLRGALWVPQFHDLNTSVKMMRSKKERDNKHQVNSARVQTCSRVDPAGIQPLSLAVLTPFRCYACTMPHTDLSRSEQCGVCLDQELVFSSAAPRILPHFSPGFYWRGSSVTQPMRSKVQVHSRKLFCWVKSEFVP